MTKRKFRDVTRGGYWVENIQPMQAEGVYVLTGLVGNHSSEPPSYDPQDWEQETWTECGYYQLNCVTKFDLIEETE
jgi:hypothetical protein